MQKQAPSPASQPSRLTLLDLPVCVILMIVDKVFENSFYQDYKGYITNKSGYDMVEEIDTGRGDTYRAFDHWKDLSRMAASCKPFYNIITPILYRRDVQFNHSSALLLSAKKGNLDGILKSIDLGHADLNMEDHTDFVEDEDIDCRSYGVEDRWREGVTSTLTALHLAAYHAHPAVVDFLLNHGADVQKRADIGPKARPERMFTHQQVYMFSHTTDEYDIVCNENETSPPFGANALFFALKAGQYPSVPRWRLHVVQTDTNGIRLQMAKQLIQSGASLITRTRGEIHALHQACAYLDLNVAEFLVKELGVDPNVRDSNGNTPLHFMLMNLDDWNPHKVQREPEHVHAMFWFLVGKGADINAANHAGEKPLHLSLYKKSSIDLACLLIERGAEFDAEANSIYEGDHFSEADQRRIYTAFWGEDGQIDPCGTDLDATCLQKG
ncbi:putative ankyrin repeat protein [Colletotrichum siamense]|nr:putative ankyrin repeat protein [Colletotrichum siamense]